MSELAFNYQGQRFALPADAAWWRVRKLRDGQRGQLDVVKVGGVPLMVPIDISHDDFCAAVQHEGRYRLDALNADQMPIDAQSAYTAVVSREGASVTETPARQMPATVTAPFGTWPALPMPPAMTGAEYLLGEALRAQAHAFTTIAQAMASGMAAHSVGASQMMQAAAALVTADGTRTHPRRATAEQYVAMPVAPASFMASAPASAPRNAAPSALADADDDSDDLGPDDLATAPATDSGPQDEADILIDKLGKVMTAIGPAVPHLVTLVRGYPSTGVDGLRNATPPVTEDEPAGASDGDETDQEPSRITPAMTTHMICIQRELRDDGPLFREVLSRMDRDARRGFVARLCQLDIDDAVDAATTHLAAVKARITRRARTVHEEQSNGIAGAGCEPDGYTSSDAATTRSADDSQQDQDTYAAGHGDDDDEVRDLSEHQHAQPDATANVAEMLVLATHDDAGRALLHEDAGAVMDAAGFQAIAPSIDRPADSRMEGRDVSDGIAPPHRPPHRSKARVTTTARLPAADPDVHMRQIAQHLSLTEMLQARSLAGTLTPADRAAWTARLIAMSPIEAATVIRAELARRAER